MLKKSEAIYLQLKALGKDLPEEIEDIIGEDKTASPATTPEHGVSTASTPSEPRRNDDGMQTQTLHAGGSCNGHSPPSNPASSQNSPSSNHDDSSIEILPDQTHAVF
jgi:hypothetical protein